MSKSKINQVSTKKASKIPHNNVSPFLKELITSGDALSGKTNFSFNFSQSFNNKESLPSNVPSKNELNLLAELDALDMSIIPNESNSTSFIKASVLEKDKKSNAKEESAIKLKPLVLETSQVKHKLWCQSCILTDSKAHGRCEIS
ncbi:hypothetical protein SteCoe_34708 [Stentor coeruleus]|uniref:Uncharacterized protein n=1 Tax=Stentor coeruleus TaxID=5963 RepID=A0A1R2AU04_9CILI|nr:hypothetical protein SteCoe_34708 [Stentor coeruleus]